MTTAYAIRLDYPPTINTYWRRAGHRIYLSAAGRAYKAGVMQAAGSVFDSPSQARLGVQIELAAPNKTRDTDLDNRVKAILDGLEGTAFENDRQIDQLIVRRLPVDVGGDGFADVIVSELPTPVRGAGESREP